MAYEHKEGKGNLFPNTFKKADTHPDYRGIAKWKGEEIEISLWNSTTQAGGEKLSVSIGYPFKKEGQSDHNKAKANGYAPQTDADDDIPF